MMTPAERLMRDWLASGTPAQRAHAARRLALPFAPEHVPGPPSPAPAAPELPPLPTQALNLARALGRAAAAVVTGAPVLLGAEAVAARLAVCGPCAERTAGGRCAGCGCVVAAAARLATKNCPLGKWPGDEALMG